MGRGRQGDKPREVDVAAAGLALLAGDADSARRLEIELQQSGDLQAPVQMGELGWWHYLNGDYQKAVDMLSAAVQQRPGDLNLWLGLAWAQIEIRRYGDALQTLNGAIYEQKIQPERAMVRAVANWQAQEHDEAMRDFDIALGRPGTIERCSHEVEQHSSPFESRPILIRADMSNLNCHFSLLNARRRQPCSFGG